mgnify:CR=1 FL=1
MDLTYGNVKTIAVRNCTVSNIGRCFLRTNNAGNTIEAIEFTNCIITDCGANGYCFLYPQHGVKSVSVKNSTLKNYISGESFFSPKNTTSDIDLTFVFENNTVYKWSKSSSYALCKVDGKYSENSTYTFKNNIISTPGVEGQKPLIVSAKGGTLIAEKNLIDNYGGYSVSNASSSTIEDLSLETLGITQIFPDPENPGFKHILLRPNFPCGLNEFEAKHQSPYGEICSKWERKKNRIIYHVTVPANSIATFYAPDNVKGERVVNLEAGEHVLELLPVHSK